MAIRIVADLAGAARRASFGAQLRGAELHLPVELGAALARHQLRSAEELLACASSFPSLLGSELGWSLEEVSAALAELTAALEGSLPPELLHPAPPPPHPQS